MLILGHLVIGLIIGFILCEIFHARTFIIFCALGSVLSDLVDKGLGHIIFSSSLDTGRIFFHSLGMVLVFAVVGLIVWNHYRIIMIMKYMYSDVIFHHIEIKIG
jgi:hypothetical protein